MLHVECHLTNSYCNNLLLLPFNFLLRFELLILVVSTSQPLIQQASSHLTWFACEFQYNYQGCYLMAKEYNITLFKTPALSIHLVDLFTL